MSNIPFDNDPNQAPFSIGDRVIPDPECPYYESTLRVLRDRPPPLLIRTLRYEADAPAWLVQVTGQSETEDTGVWYVSSRFKLDPMAVSSGSEALLDEFGRLFFREEV